ncbi:PAS domain S-box protein [Desulfonatronospira sp.]|uniref:PAS domain S-box protein n=1 Tax=Desulfonatronospira sp. TaxID=1962951 RepID=UPI0025B9A2A7|nr:PAS domain S-box protein [Desulfonatronospira sp.]
MVTTTIYKEIFDLSPDGIVLIDPETALPIDFNQAAHENLGYTREEFLGLRISDYEALETPEQTRAHIFKILETGRDDFETLHKARDGSIKNVLVTVKLAALEEKQVFLAFFRDITQTKEAERQAGELYDRLVKISSQVPGVVYQFKLTPQGKFSFPYASEGIRQVYGIEPEEVREDASPVFELLHPEDSERVLDSILESAHSLTPWTAEYRVVLARGEEKWLLGRASPHKTEEGTVVWHGFIADISLQKNTQKELEGKTRELEGFFHVSLDLLCIADLEGRFIKLNKAWGEILGYIPSELENRKFLDFVHPEDMDKTLEAISSLDKGESVLNFVNRYRCSDGGYRYIEWRSHAHGSLIYSAARDITDRIQTEEALRYSEQRFKDVAEAAGEYIWENNVDGVYTFATERISQVLKRPLDEIIGSSPFDFIPREEQEKVVNYFLDKAKKGESFSNLEHRSLLPDGGVICQRVTGVPMFDQDGCLVGYRGAGLDITEEVRAREAMQQAMDAAKSASRAKGEFLANMSHEIRTPMNAVIGLSQLLLQTELSEKQQDYLLKIHNSSRMLLGIINDILDYSKIEAGRLELEERSFHLDELLDQVVALFGSAASAKGLELLLRVDPDVPKRLVGDSLRLGQVLTNLTSNAMKFTEKGSVELDISLESLQGDRAELCFAVKDTGIGMDETQQKHLFQSFSQGDTSTTRKYGGTGLGLVISRKLVEIMGGNLGFTSTQGGGSSFYFNLNLSLDQDIIDENECQEYAGKKVLVVDDHHGARKIISEILESCLFHVVEAASGQEALKLMLEAEDKGRPYDFILMDWNMPEMDGLETSRRIQDLKRKGRLAATSPTILMLSAYNRDEIQIDEGLVADFLSKPVTASSLFDAMIRADRESIQPRTGYIFKAPSFKGKTILLVEDNEINLEVAFNFLEKTGASVVTAEDGAQGVEKVFIHNPDLVLMDLQMPVMDGYNAAREIRKSRPDLPIIALTAAVMQDDVRQSREAGMNDHLGKPIDSEELYRVLAQWLEPGENVPSELESQKDAWAGPEKALPGFDLKTGLHRADGDQVFYSRMLSRFKDSIIKEYLPGLSLLRAEDPEEGRRMAHTLKGIAGTLGAFRVQEAATKIDKDLKEGLAVREDLLQELQDSLEEAMGALSGLHEETSRLQETDFSGIQEDINALSKGINNSEFIEYELLSRVSSYMKARGGGQKVEEFMKKVDNFEYDTARDLFEELLRNLQ